MATTEVREIDVDRPCPLCGGQLKQQQGRWVSAEGVPADWSVTMHRCVNSCLLTAQDLA
jgi:hypothetical protein